LAQPPNLHRPVVRQAFWTKGAVKLSGLSVAGPLAAPVRVSVAAAQNKVNLVRHLAVEPSARREAEKSLGNLAPINLQPCRLPVRVRFRAKREVDEREDKAPTLNLPASQKAERQLRLSKGRGNPQRKKERGLQRRGPNNLANFRGGSEAEKFRSRFY
jgi:hypothetical protein